MDARVLEAAYQLTNFTGSREVLARDFELRYGDEAPRVMAAAEELARDAEGVKREVSERRRELEALVESRIGDRGLASLYAAYGWRVTGEGELEVAMELLGAPGSLSRLIAWGLAMHYTDDVVASPPYLAGLLMRLAREARYELDLGAELASALEEPWRLALLEAHLTGRADWALIREIYEAGPETGFAVGRVAAYRPGTGLVVNPAASPDEVLDALAALKDSEARRIFRWLGIPGEYEFRRRAMAGVVYISPGEGSASAILIYPWVSRIPRGSGRIVLIRAAPRRIDAHMDDMLIFLWGSALYVRPPRKMSDAQEYVLDLLYRDHMVYEEW